MAAINGVQWARIYAKAWKDPQFKNLLETDPKTAVDQVAAEFGLDHDCIISIPDRPDDLTDEQLTSIQNGGTHAHVMGAGGGPSMCC